MKFETHEWIFDFYALTPEIFNIDRISLSVQQSSKRCKCERKFCIAPGIQSCNDNNSPDFRASIIWLARPFVYGTGALNTIAIPFSTIPVHLGFSLSRYKRLSGFHQLGIQIINSIRRLNHFAVSRRRRWSVYLLMRYITLRQRTGEGRNNLG